MNNFIDYLFVRHCFIQWSKVKVKVKIISDYYKRLCDTSFFADFIYYF